jgi:tRNA threonylcarbamoyladenosine biosynthesis protein TsaB
MELLLSLSTATPGLTLAVSRGENLLSELLLAPAKTQGNLLFPAIDQVLAAAGVGLAEVDAFAVVHGPGAFTGLRVGVAAIKGLAQASGKPVVGVSALQALALQGGESDLPVCALLDARKGEVYAGLFQWQQGRPQRLQPEQVAPPECVLAAIKGPVCFVGDGASVYRTLIVRQLGSQACFVPWAFSPLRAASVAVLALDVLRNGAESSPLLLEPVYIRLSEAEINRLKSAENGGIEG